MTGWESKAPIGIGRKQTMTESTERMTADVQRFNGLSQDEVRATLGTCLAVPRWVEEVASSRPYADADAVLAQADASARSLNEHEVAAALTRHPRIGERSTADDEESRVASREQSGVDDTDSVAARRLAEGNAAYEARFGQVFLIRAKGRNAWQIVAELERRLGNDEQTESAEVAGQLREIAVLRLQEVLAQ
jgi:2-oxo-4-hydroxy-4-carboxy-5-ureidoimidazoline decarboxylase